MKSSKLFSDPRWLWGAASRMYRHLRAWSATFPSLGALRLVRGITLAAILGLTVTAVLVPISRLSAQEASPGQNPPSSPASANASGREAQPSQAAEGKEAKETDENEAIRHSSPVRFIARITGLSLDQAYWLCVLINFAIVFVSVAWALRKKLPGVFKSRTGAIQQRIEEARKTSEEARRRLAEVEGRLARLDVEIAEMRREAAENAGAQDKRIQVGTEEESRRIVAAAEQEITIAANAARRELKAYSAELAVDLAEKKIKVGKDTDQALVREFTSQLGKDGH
jgi:F-type H+-transporting ATPase subunit b